MSGFSQQSFQNKAEFETGPSEEKDKVGMWIMGGIIAAAGVAAGIVIPLMVNDKL